MFQQLSIQSLRLYPNRLLHYDFLLINLKSAFPLIDFIWLWTCYEVCESMRHCHGLNSRPGMLECVGEDVFSDSESLDASSTLLRENVWRRCSFGWSVIKLNWSCISMGKHPIIADGKWCIICLQDLYRRDLWFRISITMLMIRFICMLWFSQLVFPLG